MGGPLAIHEPYYKQTKQKVKTFLLVHMTMWLTLSFNNTTSEKRWDLKKVAVDTFYLYHDEWFLFASFPISPKWMEVCGILTKASNTKQIGPQCVLQFFHVSIEYSYPRNFTIYFRNFYLIGDYFTSVAFLVLLLTFLKNSIFICFLSEKF